MVRNGIRWSIAGGVGQDAVLVEQILLLALQSVHWDLHSPEEIELEAVLCGMGQ